MEKNVLLEQKAGNLQMALNRQEGTYVPNMINNGTATVAWEGKKTSELMMGNPMEYVEVLNKIYEEMWADANILSGNMFSPKMEQAFDTLETRYGPDGVTPEHVQLSPMKQDEYDQLIADPNRYVANVLLPRKFPTLFTDREGAKRSLKLYAEDRFYSMIQLMGMSARHQAEKYGIVQCLNMQERFETPLDILFDYFRGFRGTLTDLRRQRANVEAALDKLWETRCAAQNASPVKDANAGWGPQFCHIPAYLSPKQYDELFWPHQKKQIERLANAGGKAYIVLEGRWEKIWHHFLELPKDCCVLHIDDDDIVTAKKALGDHQILVGGLKTADVRMKSFEQIRDDVKRVIDECAPGGGFLYSTDKCWIASGDVNQTLIDAYNFAHEYSKK